MHRFHIMMPDDLYETLRELAHANRASMAEEVRKALVSHVSREKSGETSKHIKMDMENDPDKTRNELFRRMNGGKIG